MAEGRGHLGVLPHTRTLRKCFVLSFLLHTNLGKPTSGASLLLSLPLVAMSEVRTDERMAGGIGVQASPKEDHHRLRGGGKEDGNRLLTCVRPSLPPHDTPGL